MSMGSKPQVVDNSPWTNMPDWVKTYYQNQISRASQSDNRADALRQMYSGFTPQERQFVENYQTPGSNQAAPMAQSAPTQDLLSRLALANQASGGGMWSDGMSGAQIEAERAAGTFGSGMPDSARGTSYSTPTTSSGTINSGGLY